MKDDVEFFDIVMTEMQEAGLDALPVPDVNSLKTGEYFAVYSNDFWFRFVFFIMKFLLSYIVNSIGENCLLFCVTTY